MGRKRKPAESQQKNLAGEELYRSVFDATPDSITLSTINEGRFLDVNDGFCALTGYARDEVINRTVSDINIWQDFNIRRQMINNLKKHGYVKNMEACFVDKEGQTRTGLVHANILTIKGKPCLLTVIRDYTLFKKNDTSLRRYKHIINASHDHIAFVNKDYKYSKVNEAYLAAHDKKRDDVIDKTVTEVFGEQVFHSTLKPQIDRALGGERTHYQYWFDYPKRGRRYMDVVYSPFYEEDKSITGIVVNSRDITIRKMAEDALEKYKHIVSASRDHMSFVDNNYIYQAVNDAYLKAHNKTREKIVGHHVSDLLGRESFETVVKDKLDRCLNKGEQVQYDAWFEFPGTGRRYMEVMYYPFYEKGNVVAVVVNARDITDKEQLKSQLFQAQKMEAIGTLAGGIAHDFNNILTGIIGCTELALFDVKEDSSIKEHLQKTLKACKRAANLVRQILTYSRKKENIFRPITLGPIIKEALKLIRSSLPATIDIKQDIIDESKVVVADSVQLHQVIMNLCTNAAHAMKKNGGTLEVTLSECEVNSNKEEAHYNIAPGTYVKLAVRDTGIGIQKKFMDKIFDPYFTTKDIGEGTGLGLAVVQGIVKNHSGAINVTSKQGVGTQVEILFPSVEEALAPYSWEECPALKGDENILLVDDEDIFIQTQQQILTRLGYKVIGTSNSVEALSLFQENPTYFDIVITDQIMPNLTGLEMAKKILQLRPDMKIILCSGFSDDITPEKAYNLGIKDFIEKPYTKSLLTKKIRKLLDDNS